MKHFYFFAISIYLVFFSASTFSQGSRQVAEPLRIVPVVFHIIHEGGPENISKAQILDQMRILNLDFRKRNDDTANIPGPFKAVAADCNVEFRLAKKDPSGRCTDGIDRIFSHLTNNVPYGFQDTMVKYLSVWDNSRYLNIWVIKNFKGIAFDRTLLGLATLPDTGPNALDGVIVVANNVGSIEYAANNSNEGRVVTHEIGHWLDLHHVWGDANCGDDFVADTPPQKEFNKECPPFPHITCGGPNGDMFSNYMDYTDGSCRNLFTNGQKLRMDAVFAGFRSTIIASSNLVFTGISDTTSVLCAPKAAFSANSRLLCAGNAITFTEGTYNGLPSNFRWTFEGGQPATSGAKSQLVTYPNPGLYKVKLFAENAAGKDSLTLENMIYVAPAAATYKSLYAESFEGPSYPNDDWIIANDARTPSWQKTTEAAYTGNASIKVNNFSGNPPNALVELISPVLDLSAPGSQRLFFRIAYGQKDPSFSDQLNIFYSTDCGQFWLPAYSKSGNILSAQSGGLQYNYYIPKKREEWRLDSVDLAVSPYKRQRVRIKFQFIGGGGNNIYLDDIRIGNPLLGIETGLEEKINFIVAPNPVTAETKIRFTLNAASTGEIRMYDAFGRIVNTVLENRTFPPGDYEYALETEQTQGIYFLKARFGTVSFVKKIVF
jgi:PKD repeat protein